jgi:ABC-type Fe3+/spermidine/putrescine transport system ATPase subunit
MFILENISKSYGPIRALDKININIPSNNFVVILGPSGCGKSTLLRQLSFIEIPDQGIVMLNLNGATFKSDSTKRPWPKLTCVFQKQFLWPHLTLKENIELPLKNNQRSTPAEVEKIIEQFEMEGFINRYPNEVSGGQAQRAALVRAFVLKPEIMLIDEAHGGLDLEQQHILNSHFVSLKHTGVGLIIVTHSLEFAQKYADFIVVLENGRVTDSGDQSIFKNPSSRFLHLALSSFE